ncbi:MAG: hypothetical protein GY867_05620 [bacterium]|nr:hypothetical protein [bacterium]
MKMKRGEVIVLLVLAVGSVLAYLGKINGWHSGFMFPKWLSITIVSLTFLSMVWMLVRTIQGKLVERRIVFLYVGIAVALPLLMELPQKIIVSDIVRAVYTELEALQPGSKVLVSFDYDPASAPELQPMAEAFIAECFERDLTVIMMGLWPQGPQQAAMAVDSAMKRMGYTDQDKVYGVDYVNLGYQAGNEFVIQRMGSSFQSMFKTDFLGTPYEDIPLVKNVKNFSNINFSFNLSSGFPGTVEWVQVAVDRYGLRMGAGNTAVQAPTIYPYVRSKQVLGLLGGMNGGAEFETVTGLPGKAIGFMLPQSFAHLIVIGFIIIGNVAFFREGRKSRLKG